MTLVIDFYNVASKANDVFLSIVSDASPGWLKWPSLLGYHNKIHQLGAGR